MKKILLAVLLLLTICQSSQAQVIRFIDNTFVTLGGGVNWYGNDYGSVFNKMTQPDQLGAPSFDVAFGKWIFNPVALRVSYSGFRATNVYPIPQPSGTKSATGIPGLGDSTATASTLFLAPHVDLIWDVMTSIKGLKPRNFNIYPFIGFGMVYRLPNPYVHRDTDFTALAGVDVEWAFAPNTMPGWKLFAQGKVFMFSSGFDNNTSTSSLFDLQAGLKYDIHPMPYRHRVSGESRLPGDDWYIGFGAGLNFAQTHAFSGFETNLQPIGDIFLGKYFTTLLSARLQANFGMCAINENTNFTYYNLHGDILFDVMNIKFAVRNRPFSVLPYLGAGVINRTDTPKLQVSADLGAFLRIYLNKHSDLYFDVRYAMAHSRFIRDFEGVGQRAFSFGIPSISFGYIRNLGTANCR